MSSTLFQRPTYTHDNHPAFSARSGYVGHKSNTCSILLPGSDGFNPECKTTAAEGDRLMVAGAADGTRTRNFQLGKLTLYH